MNPPSAYAVPSATIQRLPNSCGRFRHRKVRGPLQPRLPFFWGVWKFSKNKSAARSLLTHLSQRSSAEKLVIASGGFDIPAFSGLRDFKIWGEVAPPKGTLYHYPRAAIRSYRSPAHRRPPLSPLRCTRKRP